MSTDYFTEYLRENIKYNPETGQLFWSKPGKMRKLDKPLGSVIPSGHRQLSIMNMSFPAATIIWRLVYGRAPEGIIDHINHNPDDNRLCNLREAVNKENALNRKAYPRPLTPHIPHNIEQRPSGNYRAHVQKNRRIHYSPTVKTLDEAILLRDQLLEKLGFHENHGK